MITIPIYVVILIGILVVILSILTYKSISRAFKYESIALDFFERFKELRNTVDENTTKLQSLEVHEAFKADDEVGEYFKTLVNVDTDLQNILKKYSYERN